MPRSAPYEKSSSPDFIPGYHQTGANIHLRPHLPLFLLRHRSGSVAWSCCFVGADTLVLFSYRAMDGLMVDRNQDENCAEAMDGQARMVLQSMTAFYSRDMSSHQSK